MDLRTIARQIPNYNPFEKADDYFFDEEAAALRIEFVELACVHVKGRWANKPFIMDNWQKAIVANLYGWKHKDSGLRRYREALIYIPRKNGKTILAAALANAAFFIDGEAGAEVYTCGFEKDQASLSWDMAKQMVLRKPALKKKCKVYKSTRIMEKPDGSVFKPLSHESESKHGFSTHLAIFDELHTYRDNTLIEAIASSTGAREEPLLLYITTADFEREGSPCNEKHDYAKQVQLDPAYDMTFLPVIYEAALDDDWKDPKTWAKANPGLGVSVTLDYLATQCKKAQKLPSFTNSFKRLMLNLRTGQDVVWIPAEDWKACYRPEITLADLAGKTCFSGLDLASTRDLCALAHWFPELSTLLLRCWSPVKMAHARRETNRGKYLEWAELGHLTLTPGNVADYAIIQETILQDKALFNMVSLGVDRWNSTKLINELREAGVDVVPFGQGFASMSAPTKEFEKLIMTGNFNHMDNPLMSWAFGNVRIIEDKAGNVKPDKEKSADKIDPIVAAIMAIGMAMLSPVQTGSVYDSGGLMTL